MVKCSNHQHNEESLVEYFRNGLLLEEVDHIDTSTNGLIIKLDAKRAWDLIKEGAYKRHNRRRRARLLKGIAPTEPNSFMEKITYDMEKLYIFVKEISTCLPMT